MKSQNITQKKSYIRKVINISTIIKKTTKITNIKNMRKSSVEKNALTINTENTIKKNEQHDENFKN